MASPPPTIEDPAVGDCTALMSPSLPTTPAATTFQYGSVLSTFTRSKKGVKSNTKRTEESPIELDALLLPVKDGHSVTFRELTTASSMSSRMVSIHLSENG